MNALPPNKHRFAPPAVVRIENPDSPNDGALVRILECLSSPEDPDYRVVLLDKADDKWVYANDCEMAVVITSEVAQALKLDEPLTDEQFADILKWYEEEVSTPEFAATHDCRVVRALRELKRLREAKVVTTQPTWRGLSET